MKKVVVKLAIHDDKEKQKAMKAVSGLSGIESISMDMKEKKLTVVGDVDPIDVVGKLRKTWHTDIVSVGPAKEEKKEGGDKKDGGKKDDGKKDDAKKKTEAELYQEFLKQYQNFYPYGLPQPYVVYSAEENPNSCVIC